MQTKPEFAILDAGIAKLELGWKPRRRTARREGRVDFIKVHGRIRAPEGSWTFADSCLMVEEVEPLTAWLNAVAATGGNPSAIAFLEHNLAFESARAPRDMVLLRVRFRGEISPPWLWGDSDAVWETGYWLDLPVTPDQVRAFATALGRLIGH